MKQQSTMCFVIRDNAILLGLRKKNPRKGTWSGYGGKVEQGESIIDAAQRELLEEACIKSLAMVPLGVVTFVLKYGHEEHNMHLFRVDDFEGVVRETSEMTPKWFKVGNIPYDQMSITDTCWLPPLLEGERLTGLFNMSPDYVIQTYGLRTF